MAPPPAPLSSRGRASRLQECQQPLGPPRGPYREGRAAAPHRTLPRTVRPWPKCRLIHAPHSYVNDDKVYCVYIAPNGEMVREHARQGGFPANRVSEIRSAIDPTTAEG